MAGRRIDGFVAGDGQHLLGSAGKIYDSDLRIFFRSNDDEQRFFATRQMLGRMVYQLTVLSAEPGDGLRIASSARDAVETGVRADQNVAIRPPAAATPDKELAEASLKFPASNPF